MWVVLSVIAIYITLRFSSVNDTSSTLGVVYAPNDSHLVSFSNAFCQHLIVSVNGGRYGYNTSLYLLKSRPKLIGNEVSNFTDQPLFGSKSYQKYYYYLYSGSSVNVSACYTDYDGRDVIFYLLKGNDTYHYFKHNSVDMDTSRAEIWFQVKTQCSGKNKSFSHTVNASDYYYFVFYTGVTNRFLSVFNVSLSFNRTRYLFTSVSIVSSCTVDTQAYSKSCSVVIPLSGTTALLSFQPNSNNEGIDWVEDKAELRSSCSPRVWMYVIVSFAITVVIVVLMVLLGYVCVILAKFQKKRKPYEPISSCDRSVPPPDPSVSTSSTTDEIPSPLENSPPPQNLDFCDHVPAAAVNS